MTTPHNHFGELLAARLEGQSVEVPADLQADVDQALAAHDALCALLDPTLIPTAATSPTRPPPVLSTDYEIERELGHGGMGVVYLARQKSLNRDVAIKVLRPGERTFTPLLRRFLDEARHLAQLRHPHIVAIHEVGDAAGEPYFTMDYIDGESLAARLSRGALTPSLAVEVLRQVASALQHAHRQGIIHRDLKPGNVLLDRAGQAFVTDFGLARNITRDSTHTQSGELLGTPQYMAPEQARGDAPLIGEATDIHALGLLLFEMLTGRPAFQARSPAEAIVRLLREEPPALRQIDRRIPRDLETICLKCLQKSPSDRYTNVSALLEDLRRFECGEPLAARRPGWGSRTVRWLRRHARLAATVTITALLVFGLSARLMDRSYGELVAWGDEELSHGRASVAAQVYTRAWQRGGEAERRQLTDRLIQTCRLLDPSQAVVDLALLVLKYEPDASFGRHDVLVAQALVTRERAASETGAIDIWRAKPRPELELIERRIELAFARGVPEEQRHDLEQALTAVKLILASERPYVRYTPEYLHQLPAGTIEELQALADDPTAPWWNRGRAAIALGRRLERQGDRAAAAQEYLRAYGWMRQVYPYTGGVTAARGAVAQTVVPDAEECRLVHDLLADLERVSPGVVPAPRGGLAFEIAGARLPADFQLDLNVELCDPAIEYPDQGLSHALPRGVPLHPGGTRQLQLLDGQYRLRIRGWRTRWEPQDERFARLLQVDTTDWPAEVDIRGEMLPLPPVTLRLADEVELTEPASGATLDLREAELRWQPVSGASRYQVQLLYTAESPSPVTVFFLQAATSVPRLRFADLPDHERAQIAENLTPGRTGGWKVDAFDEQGRKIGTSLHEFRFLVAGSLTPS